MLTLSSYLSNTPTKVHLDASLGLTWRPAIAGRSKLAPSQANHPNKDRCDDCY